MKKILIALTAAVGISTAAQAQVSTNIGATTDYRFRGVSQTQNSLAVQGGVDLDLKNGFYVGNWNSSVSTEVYTGGAGVEVDLYAGYKRKFGDFTVDVGSYNYFYPRASAAGNSFTTNELYAGVSRGPVTVKVSQSVSDYFGIQNSRGSRYWSADLAQPLLAGLVGLAHIGRTDVANHTALNYTDINLGLAYDIKGWTLAGRWYVNSNRGAQFTGFTTVDGQRLGKGSVGLTLAKTFN
jgi:uncharacterized protein (TIGR02001 family)